MTRKGTILSGSATPNPRSANRVFQRLIFGLIVGWLLPAVLPATELKTMVFIGDSLTAGLGLDPDDAYPALVQKKVDADKLPWHVVNAGISGDTTAGGLRRLDWILRQKVDLVIIALGANDGLRGTAPGVTKGNLKSMIEHLRKKYPDVGIVLAGMQVPTNLGPTYTQQFAAIFPELAKECDVPLIPFLLEGVGGHPELNQADGMHPTAEGQARLADNVWTIIVPLLKTSPSKAP